MVSLPSLARTALAAGLLACAGCSLALQTDAEQCVTDADCSSRGAGFVGTFCQSSVCVEKHDAAPPPDPKWGCIGSVEPIQAGKMDTLSTKILDLISGMPPTGISLKLCNKYDPPCASPLGMPVPDVDGKVTVTVPSDTEAYLEITGGGYIPTLLFLDHRAEPTNPEELLVPSATVDALSSAVGVPYDNSKGILLVRTTDCTLYPTAGAAISIFPAGNATRFYTINSLTTPNASQTDSAGNAGYVNVEPGTPTVTGTVGPEGKTYGSVTTLIRAGHMTAVIVPPTQLN
jgi:cytochrome c5